MEIHNGKDRLYIETRPRSLSVDRLCWRSLIHYGDVIMSAKLSQITSVSIFWSTICSGADQGKYQSSASLASVREIHRWLVDSSHKGKVTRKTFLFDDVIMVLGQLIWRPGPGRWNHSTASFHISRCDVSWSPRCGTRIVVSGITIRACPPYGVDTQIAKFMGPTWGPPGSCRPHMGPCWPHEPCYQGRFNNGILIDARFPRDAWYSTAAGISQWHWRTQHVKLSL